MLGSANEFQCVSWKGAGDTCLHTDGHRTRRYIDASTSTITALVLRCGSKRQQRVVSGRFCLFLSASKLQDDLVKKTSREIQQCLGLLRRQTFTLRPMYGTRLNLTSETYSSKLELRCACPNSSKLPRYLEPQILKSSSQRIQL